MKYSNKYEVAIKKAVANLMEIRELKRIAHEEMHKYHINMHTQAVSIEMLNKIEFKLINGYITFDKSGIRRKLRPIISVKLGEEQFAERDDRALTARLNFKKAVTKIIIKL